MRKVRALLLRLAGLVPRRSPDREVEAELKSHIDLHVADLMQKGIPVDEARRRALAALGGIEPTKERHREVRGFRAVDELGRDLRDAVRGLVRNPSSGTASRTCCSARVRTIRRRSSALRRSSPSAPCWRCMPLRERRRRPTRL